MKHISWNIVDFTVASRPVLRSNEYANSIVLFVLSQERIKGHETLMRQDTGIENDLVFQSSNRATQLFLFCGIQLLCFQCWSLEFIIFITNSKLTLLSWATTWESHKTVIPDTSGAWYTVLKRERSPININKKSSPLQSTNRTITNIYRALLPTVLVIWNSLCKSGVVLSRCITILKG